MRNMDIKLVPVELEEFDNLFSVVKQALYSHVDAVFGWSDDFQFNRLKNDYEFSWFHWVERADQRIGLLCFKPYDNALHVHLLVVFPEFQRQSFGRDIMNHVHNLALVQRRSHVTLSSFIRNDSAVRFYKSLGYQLVDSDENFLSLSLQVTS
ncbi:GNAT family N-acetyltransferase [Vibrio metschnikovii]|uniref:GNAT family N-acetyltransferase n=1 Tax=Vibrio metschnikovii TaxID=28172 RepID=UPI001C304C2A|nr:GNAT family N-acetyltransferase [Vibrio metschnikovii]